MQTALRKMGNSTGMILPKPILKELGIDTGTEMNLVVENGRVIATPIRAKVRDGWAEAAREIGADALHEVDINWLAAPNDGDADLKW